MKSSMTIAAVVAVLASTAALADGPVGYPGSTWGQATYPSSVIPGTPDSHDYTYQGKVTQGVDWFRFGSDKKWTFDTYASFGFTVDTQRLWWNDKIDPAIGMRLERAFDKGVIDIGVEGVYEHHFSNYGGYGITSPMPLTGTGVQAYVSYWFGWNLGH